MMRHLTWMITLLGQVVKSYGSGRSSNMGIESLHNKRQIIPYATWGPYVDLGFTKTEYIKLTTIYSPGTAPPNHRGTIFLWPGLWDRKNQNKANLIQTVVEMYAPSELRQACGAKPGQWCIRPFVVDYTARPMSQFPRKGTPIEATDKILIEYTKAPGPGGNWTQRGYKLGNGEPQKIFEFERGSKGANWMRLATEYQNGNTVGTVDVQSYWNTTLTVREAEPELGKTFRVTGGIQATPPTTPDGGKTWIIAEAKIPAKTPLNAGSA